MSQPPIYSTLDEWASREGAPFSLEDRESLDTAVDRLVAALGSEIELLGLGEPMHGAEVFLRLRNAVFQRLVEKHGYSAIAIESSFPRGAIANEFVLGHGPATYDDVQETGFSHQFGRDPTTRELVEWMRRYNSGTSRGPKLHIYGFDSPTEAMYSDSPRHLLHFALDYLDAFGSESNAERRARVDELLGDDAAWETTEAAFNPSQSIGLSPAAAALRTITEDLIAELHIRRPELAAASSPARYAKARRYAEHARQMLTYHAAIARDSPDRLARCLGMRDAMMADNLAYIVERERGRGKVLAFAHNSHVKRGAAEWQLGPQLIRWWPAGSQAHEIFGSRYAVVGTAVGKLESQNIGRPEPGSLEAIFSGAESPARFVVTHRGAGLPPDLVASLTTRTGSSTNGSYFPLNARSIEDFDALVFIK